MAATKTTPLNKIVYNFKYEPPIDNFDRNINRRENEISEKRYLILVQSSSLIPIRSIEAKILRSILKNRKKVSDLIKERSKLKKKTTKEERGDLCIKNRGQRFWSWSLGISRQNRVFRNRKILLDLD